jgi:adenine C2-methylase RlmN of 23S rRNA A2503 and tRNA A37
LHQEKSGNPGSRILIVKNVLTWFYHRKIRRNEAKAETLKKEKADILEKVMETETYKVAKEILEKFGAEPPAARPGAMVTIFILF